MSDRRRQERRDGGLRVSRRFKDLWRSVALCVATGTAAASRLVWLSAKYYLYSVTRVACVRLGLAVPFPIRIISAHRCVETVEGRGKFSARGVFVAHSTGPVRLTATASTCSYFGGSVNPRVARWSTPKDFAARCCRMCIVHSKASVQVTDRRCYRMARAYLLVFAFLCASEGKHLLVPSKCIFFLMYTQVG